MNAVAHHLSGNRLHLQHGPIDLVIWADGPGHAREMAFSAAQERFGTILQDLVDELPQLRSPMTADTALPLHETARLMDRAVRPLADVFVTRMAAVAGAVADTVLKAMRGATPLTRAYVNNGGDIALHLSSGTRFDTAISDLSGAELGRIAIRADDGIGGIATSGRHGRSLSLGIADSVTVLAKSAAAADAAATLIANAVDLPGHRSIRRRPAAEIDPDSDLGSRDVVTGCAALTPSEVSDALEGGLSTARRMAAAQQIKDCALFLQGQSRILGNTMTTKNRSLADA